MPAKRHIVLMGFKHVGKSAIGQALAQRLGLPFYELDDAIESLYHERSSQKMTCRQIVASQGEGYFRALETDALAQTLKQPVGVLSLGGGAVMADANRSLIRGHIPVHITAPQETVRERVTAAGWPQAARFNEIWYERNPVYRKLAQITVENTETIAGAVSKIMERLK